MLTGLKMCLRSQRSQNLLEMAMKAAMTAVMGRLVLRRIHMPRVEIMALFMECH